MTTIFTELDYGFLAEAGVATRVPDAQSEPLGGGKRLLTLIVEIVVFIAALIGLVVLIVSRNARLARMSPEQQNATARDAGEQLLYGSLSDQIVCPHCQTRGSVRTQAIKRKAGISGGKATAAILTGGISLIATGLSRKEAVTQAHCGNCNSTWSF